MDSDQALGCLAAHRVGDAGADVAALGDVPGVAETPHELGPGACGAAEAPADLERLAGEPISRQRGKHEMERILGLPPCAVGSASGPTESIISITEPGQPWVMISGSAFSCDA